MFLSVCTIWVYHETPSCFSFFNIIYNLSYNLPAMGLLGTSKTLQVMFSFTSQIAFIIGKIAQIMHHEETKY